MIETVASWPGERTSAGEELAEEGQRRGPRGRQGVGRGWPSARPARAARRSSELARVRTWCPARRVAGERGVGAGARSISQSRVGARALDAGSRPTRGAADRGSGTPPRAAPAQLDALAGGDPDLDRDVRRVGRAADAVGAQVHLADLGMDTEDQLDGAGEVERVVQVAGRAMAVIANRPERVHDLAGDPADRAEQVPEQHEQPLLRALAGRPWRPGRVRAPTARRGPGAGSARPRGRGPGPGSRPADRPRPGRSGSGASRSSALQPGPARVGQLRGLLERIDRPRAEPSLPVTAASIRR